MKRGVRITTLILCVALVVGIPLDGNFVSAETEKIIEDNWSDWSETYISSNYGEETKTLYRTREKIEKISDSASLDGWNFEGEIKEWSDWSNWSNWSNTEDSPYEDEFTQVETRTRNVSGGSTTQYRYTRYYSTNSNEGSYWVHFCPVLAKYYCGGTWTKAQTGWSTTRFAKRSFGGDHRRNCTCGYPNCMLPYKFIKPGDSRPYYWEESRTVTGSRSQYSYRIKTAKTKYKYSKWGDWSNWSETAATDSDKLKVETKQQYRFRLFGNDVEIRKHELIGAGEVGISWNDVSGASKYYIYKRANNTTQWVRAKVCDRPLTTLTLPAGDYDILIRPGQLHNGINYLGKGTEIKGIHTFGKIYTPTVKLAGQDTAALWWKPAPGANGYHVYYKSVKDGEWEQQDVGSGNSCELNINGAAGLYCFKIRPYFSGGAAGIIEHPKFSSDTWYKFMTQCKLRIKKSSKTTVRLNWTGSQGLVTGYKIYQSTRPDGIYYWKKPNIKNNRKLRKIVRQKRGKRYYYKVRPYYKMSTGEIVYGPYSSVKSCRL